MSQTLIFFLGFATGLCVLTALFVCWFIYMAMTDS